MNPRSKQLTEQAVTHHQAGRLQQALPLYQQAIAADNQNSDAHQFMGLLFLHAGKPEQGISSIRKAIAINPDVAPYHDNLGAALESIGDNEGALGSFLTASALDTENADRSFGMANTLNALGRFEESEVAYRKAIAINPNDSAFYFNLANLLKTRGDLAEACDCYQRAAERQPVIDGVYNNWGNSLLQLGRFSQAVAAFEQSLARNPKSITTLTNLASALRDNGEIRRAEKTIAQAGSLVSSQDTKVASRVFNLKGQLALQSGNYREAISAFRSVLKQDAGNDDAVDGLASTFRWIQPAKYESELARDIENLLANSNIAHQRFSRLVANQIRHNLASAFKALENPETVDRSMHEIASCNLLVSYLTSVTNTDASLEKEIVNLRKGLLAQAVSGKSADTNLCTLASACAIQAFLNEHVDVDHPVEKTQQLKLVQIVDGVVDSISSQGMTSSAEFVLSVWAMYFRLYPSTYVGALMKVEKNSCTPIFNQLIRMAVKEPEEEAALGAEIDQLGAIEDSVSSAVRAQYEQHPYPRWFSLPKKDETSYHDYLQSMFPFFTPAPELKSAVAVLSAGCGTGQEAAMIVRGRLVSEVTGLDLSATSLAHAQRMSNKMQLKNLRFVQGDILQVRKLGRKFPVIETTGVLHHMGDPVAGWQSLVNCLESRGLMKVGLYSARASVEVNNAREWIQRNGYLSDDETIRSVRQEIFAKEKDDPLYPLRYSEDFYSASACRDLIFHVQEQSYTPLELAGMLEQLELEFIGFELPDQRTRVQYLERFPADKSMINLRNWDRYDAEFPDTFSGMLVFWCQKR